MFVRAFEWTFEMFFMKPPKVNVFHRINRGNGWFALAAVQPKRTPSA